MGRKRYSLMIALALVLALVVAMLPAGFAAADDEDGNPVSVDVAKQVAVNQLNQLHLGTVMQKAVTAAEKQEGLISDTSSVAEVFTETKNGKDVYYIINLNPEGWVIVSADYVAYPIIGCSDTGSYSPENRPSNFDGWMENVKEEIYQAITENVTPLEEATKAWQSLSAPTEEFFNEAAAETDASPPPTDVFPLLFGYTWSQGGNDYWLPWIPTYDKYCPYETRKQCIWFVCWWEYQVAPTGCTATAMAQVMRYWGWPPVGEGSWSYDPDYSCTDTATHKCYGYGVRSVDFSKRYYNWGNMPTFIWNDEIALLMRDIGVAVEMDYGPGSSGAWNCCPSATYNCDEGYYTPPPRTGMASALGALKKFFRYDKNAHCEWRGDTDYYPDWANMIRAELNAGRPLIYTGYNAAGTSGHTFVCDGYTWLLELFRFNWGWGGWCDGYYRLDLLTPIGSDFTHQQRAIFGLKPAYPPNVYVDDNFVKGNCGGHAWGYNAFNNIQQGIDMVARAGGGNVWVNPGTYSRITMKTNIGLMAVGGPDVTIISGGNQGRAVTAVNIGGASLYGFSLTSGKADRGGAMYIENSDVSVGNCIFVDNLATNGGGGMYNVNSSPTVSHCTFWGNSAGVSGGGMYNNNSSPTVTNCVFVQNNASGDGGGMYNINSSPTVTNCTFWDNSAANLGDGMLNAGSSSPTVTNCIFWDKSSDEIANAGAATVAITYCDIQGGYAGEGNINKDPMFVNAAGGDVHLKSSSPCIDAGNNNAPSIPSNYDFEFDNRRIDDPGTDDTGKGTAPIVDMGADEYTPTTPAAGNDSYNVDEDQTLNIATPGVLDNDSDPQDDTLTAIKDTDPASGTLTLKADGSFTYKPSANFHGSDSFKYHATDGHTSSNTATVTINVNSVQDPPEAVEDGYSMDEDQTLNVVKPGVLENDHDPDGDPIKAIKDTDPSDGTLTLNDDGSFEYKPNDDFNGIDTFTYYATDGQANSDIVTVTININPVNDPPEAVCQKATLELDELGQATLDPTDVDGGSFDIDGEPLTLSVSQEEFTCDDLGENTVVLTVTDAEGVTDTCEATVTVEDPIPPEITCPDDVTIECGESTDPSNTGQATATDNCDPDPEISYEDTTSGTCPMVITRTWTAEDECGLNTSCTQVITVQDTTPPVMAGVPVDITVECDAVPEPAAVTAADNCDDNVEISFSEVRTDGDCPGNYTLTRTWTATDECGHTTVATQVITVQDITPPVIDVSLAESAPYYTTQTVSVDYSVNDNCDEEPIVIVELSNNSGDWIDITSDSPFPVDLVELLGQNEIRVTATDACGNTNTGSITFEVILQLPVDYLIIKPETMTVNPGEFTAFIVLPSPYDASTITDAVADGAPHQKINYNTSERKAIIKFDRKDITVLPIDTHFEVSGHFIYNGTTYQFIGSDDIKKVNEEKAAPEDTGGSPNNGQDKGKK